MSSTRAGYAALIGDILVAISKVGATIWTGSAAMTSEAIHSIVDTINEVLLLYGIHRSREETGSLHLVTSSCSRGHASVVAGGMRFFDGYCLDVPLALAAAKELSTLCLPGRNPHPVRDPTGHSYHVGPLPVATDASWLADRDKPLRMLFKSLILLSAAGVKVRERKNAAAARYAVRDAALLRERIKAQDSTIERAQGMSPATLAEHAEAATGIPAELERRRLDSLNLCSISFSDQFSREAVRTV